jgi:hypothetical protein
MNRQHIYKEMKRAFGLVPGFFKMGLVVAVIVMLAMAIPVKSSAQVLQAARIHVMEQSYSLNWAGYAVEYPNLTSPQNGVVTDVRGSWSVPAVTGTRWGSSYSAAWVGIDGYSDNTVEQIGTEQDWIWGRAVYYAWFEMYPKQAYRILAPLSPGDNVTGEVKYTGGQFTLTLNDTSKNWTFTTNQSLSGAQSQSAEWIMEAPSSWWGVLPLANFRTVTFTNASFTINGTTYTNIAAFGASSYDKINMVTRLGAPKATTSSLSNNGSSFYVTWNHS